MKPRVLLPLLLLSLCLAGCGDSAPTDAPTDDAAKEDAPPPPPTESTALPPDAIVLSLSEARNVTAPFVVKDVDGSGAVLALPEGAGSKRQAGGAAVAFTVPQPGTYAVWVRALWHDTCGNSAAYRVDGGEARELGQDAVFAVWHWVRAGRAELAQGDHVIEIVEREDGIALDQMLLTVQPGFTPVGRIADNEIGEGVRRFADDFARSPGHGLEAWDLKGGDWRIAFSFDPNRIPNQYALTGRATDGTATANIAGPPWRGCAVEASIRPTADSACGVTLADNALQVMLQFNDGQAALAVVGPKLKRAQGLNGLFRADQWHRLRVERGWRTLRVLLDGTELLNTEAEPAAKGAVGLFIARGEAAFDDVAVRGIPLEGDWTPDARVFRIGPYHFTNPRIPDPGDYLDFTAEEEEAMRKSGEWDKLRRSAKMMALVGGEKSPWRRRGGQWLVGDGVLTGAGPNAALQHWQDVMSDMEITLRMKALRPNSAAGVELFARPEPGAFVKVADALADGKWHRLTVRTEGPALRSRIDDGEWRRTPFARGDGGALLLRVAAGRVAFDDIAIAVTRDAEAGGFSAFDLRETMWWRAGNWIDHAGIACALASNWISLVAPEGEGMLWTKRPVDGCNVWVGFNVEENSAWYGWNAHPSHEHFPFDNIRVALAESPGAATGYRLEVNAENRTRTVLYRNGVAVAERAQDATFPVQFRGGHAPYSPRRNRIVLARRGGLLRVLIDGRETLRYEDPAPLATPYIGIGGHHTRINFSNAEVVPIPTAPAPPAP